MTVVIYGLIDPLTAMLRYVGKTKNTKARMATHLRLARKDVSKTHLYCWIAGLLTKNARPELEVIERVAKNEDANEAERFWIEYYKFLGCDLTNATAGGDGQSPGYIWSKAARDKLSKATKGKKKSATARSNFKAAFNTPEMRELRRRNYKKLVETNPEWLAKTRARGRGRPMSAAIKQKISDSWTPERKAKHAAIQRQKTVTPEWRAQLDAGRKARWDKYRADKASAC